MKRRQALKSLAGVSAVSALPLPAFSQQSATGAVNEMPKLDTATADSAAQSVPRFLSADQFTALDRLSQILMPAAGDTPGAKEAGAAEFLDFLISESPPDRQALYRDGLDELNAQARTRYGKLFAELGPADIHALLAPLREPWSYHGPAAPFARFLQDAKQHVMEAAMNSREWSEARAKRSRRAGGLGTYWYPIE
jgi:hypothetical protein